ncbi:hypothetical protein Shyd_56280 [Streptomyces hydrogenans]|uniref:Flavin reductase like domain-containing protein n=1 Tax=Streptomyces hydrogenans TaxID=1873719 RepID=A0ABQ3PGX0_9ACTN|nr:flavin reductase family protein [Streptomyces hydrogenans]GHI24257.1 hypothetical protein Shyd_56280 [Streptomyces hydrogenans]
MTTSAAALSPPAAGSAAKTPLRRVLGKFATGGRGDRLPERPGSRGRPGQLVHLRVPHTADGALLHQHRVRTWPYIEKSGSFAASFLADGQRAAAERFWRSDHDRFAGSPVTTATTGAPVLSEALGYVDCRVSDVLTRDDHYVVLGEVVDAGVLNAAGPCSSSRAPGTRHRTPPHERETARGASRRP